MEPTEIYQLYKPKLLNICKQYAKEDDVAEDLLHDSFVIILTSLDRLEDPEKLESWMTSIVRSVGYHYRLRVDKEQAVLQQMAKEKPETTETHLTPDYEQLQALVAQLPQGYQQVFRLSVFEGLSHQEISEMLGIAPHSSSSQLSHAKRMLRQLIKRSWVLILLLIAIPTAFWLFLQKEETIEERPQVAEKEIEETQESERPTETKDSQTITIPQRITIPSAKITHLVPSIETPDTTTYQIVIPEVETTQDTNNQASIDTTEVEEYREIIPTPTLEPEQQLVAHAKTSNPWHIGMTINGFAGSNDNYLAQTIIGNSDGHINIHANEQSPFAFCNWIDYSEFLKKSPIISYDNETRSLMNIAELNSNINGGMIEADYDHKLPFTIQLLLNRQLSKRLSIESGLSYTLLNSTINTGSPQAYIQEKQRIHYLGIPVRIGWLWYNKARLSLYSSAGAMLELPIYKKVDVNHIFNGISTFQKETSLEVPCQWSTTFGLGLQYDLTPNLGIYLEPSLQYIFNDGSDIKSYRTEHPLQITLPLGIRLHW